APAWSCTLSLHDALPICVGRCGDGFVTVLIEFRDDLRTDESGAADYYDLCFWLFTLHFIFSFIFNGFGLMRTGLCGCRGNFARRSEEHTSELQSRENLVC